MPEKALHKIAASILCGSGLIALAIAAAGGWYFLMLGVVPIACLFVLFGVVALLR